MYTATTILKLPTKYRLASKNSITIEHYYLLLHTSTWNQLRNLRIKPLHVQIFELFLKTTVTCKTTTTPPNDSYSHVVALRMPLNNLWMEIV